MQTFLSFIYLLSLVSWIGSIIFFSFFAGPAIFKVLEREKAGELVGAIFPRYYAIAYTCGVLALLTLLLGAPKPLNLRLGLLLVMMACTLVSGFVINPKARDLKMRRASAKEEKEREALDAEFKVWHGRSVGLNGTVLFVGLLLLWFTAGGLTL